MIDTLHAFLHASSMSHSTSNQTMSQTISSSIFMIFILQADIHEIKVRTKFQFCYLVPRY
jgi:hypothetical protein